MLKALAQEFFFFRIIKNIHEPARVVSILAKGQERGKQ